MTLPLDAAAPGDGGGTDNEISGQRIGTQNRNQPVKRSDARFVESTTGVLHLPSDTSPALCGMLNPNRRPRPLTVWADLDHLDRRSVCKNCITALRRQQARS
jgi:hypothetical protein